MENVRSAKELNMTLKNWPKKDSTVKLEDFDLSVLKEDLEQEEKARAAYDFMVAMGFREMDSDMITHIGDWKHVERN